MGYLGLRSLVTPCCLEWRMNRVDTLMFILLYVFSTNALCTCNFLVSEEQLAIDIFYFEFIRFFFLLVSIYPVFSLQHSVSVKQLCLIDNVLVFVRFGCAVK
uniref:Uncharacterized protein n=1 Tax=Arundo donax TaxID=35708 RepID=A0A0A8XWS9_ARUDO